MERRASIPNRVATAVVLVLGLAVLAGSLGWRGRAFPGFFLMPNRVVPSAALADWSGVAEGRPPYLELVLAVDDVPVASAAEAYARAAAHEVGAPVRYLFSSRERTEARTFPLRRLSTAEYLAIFGAYFLVGLGYVVLAAFAGERRRERPVYGGLTAFAWIAAVFSFTGMDLYGPGTTFRVHALAEALLAAAGLHLALVCPRDRLGGRPGPLVAIYGSGLALGAIYQVFLYDPRTYGVVHNACQALTIAPVLVLTVGLALAANDPPPELGPVGVRRLLAGVLAGIVLPAVVLTLSGLSNGLVPVNATAWVGLVFPLAALLAFRRPATVAAPA